VERRVKEFREEIKQLKEENKNMKKRLRKLERKTTVQVAEEDEQAFGKRKSELMAAIRNESRMQTALKMLLVEVFGEHYLCSHSITGRAGNTKLEAKPVIDQPALGLIKGIIKQKFSASDSEITGKILNIQKALRFKGKT